MLLMGFEICLLQSLLLGVPPLSLNLNLRGP